MEPNTAGPQAAAASLLLATLREPLSLLDRDGRSLDLCLRLLRRARVLGRIAEALAASGAITQLPPTAVDIVESAQAIGAARRRAALWELDRLLWALRDLPEVPTIALKGCAYALAGTPNARGRAIGDVDLMVPKARLPQVEATLRESGWQFRPVTPYDDQYYRRWTHELPAMMHAERDVEVDLHHNVLMPTARLKPDADKLFAAARSVPRSRCSVLAPADMVLHCATHLFFGSEMNDSVRELCDFHDLVQYFSVQDSQFWAALLTRAEELDLGPAAYYALRYSVRLLATPVPADVLEASARFAPEHWVRATLDVIVPRTLLPPDPDQASVATATARWLLYVRSHWVRMPPLILARHLAYKFYARLTTSTVPG